MLSKKTLKEPKEPKQFICDKCDFICCKQSSYDRHILTNKHINANIANNKPLIKEYKCNNCNITFKHLPSLSRHKKKCLEINLVEGEEENENIVIMDSSANEFKMLTNLVLELVKSNTEMQKQLLEVCKNTNNNNNTTINDNKNIS